MSAWDALIAAVALPGHVGLWAGLFNRIHATALSELAIKTLSLICHAANVFLAVEFALWLYGGGSWFHWETGNLGGQWIVRWLYAATCIGIVMGPLRNWAIDRLFGKPPAVLAANHTTVIDTAAALGKPPIAGFMARCLVRVPANHFLRLHVQEKQLVVPRWPRELDGLRIAHLSDLHCCGRLTKEFYAEVVRRTNDLRPDLVALTGDLFDERVCLDWIEDVLSQLTAPLGVYFVLGNHDLYLGDVPQTRRRLTDVGMFDLGGQWLKISARGREIVMAGNELPWHTPAADMEWCPVDSADQRAPRILLSHTPDQLEWARRWDFDLMLAGHTHGGQVRLPLVGPIFVPSRIPVRYSAGTFYEPPTVLHVSRGIAGKTPLRINCPPELALLSVSGNDASVGGAASD